MDAKILLVFAIIFEISCDTSSSSVSESKSVNGSECSIAETCGHCLKLSGCVWCKEKINTHTRCVLKNESYCYENFLENSLPKIKFIRNEQLSPNNGANEIVQLKPQRLKLTNIQPGQIVNFTVAFKQAKDYPVDVYFLMDLSNSMKDDKEQLTKLSDDIVKTMKKLTSNVTLGFGSFVDKNVQPFVIFDNTIKRSAYSFEHHLSMVNDSAAFRDSVESAAIVDTYDEPESGFDALVQVITCSKEIAWRNPSRHIILLATDFYPHLAGDGKLGGIIKPNDCKCHLNAEKRYDLELKQDYPSIGQISRLIQDNNKNLIIAVTEHVVKTYKTLLKGVKGVTVVGLKDDSSNILEILEKQYKNISSSIELLDNSNRDFVKIKYFTKCLQSIYIEKEGNNCSGLSVGSQVNFTVSIEIVDSPKREGDRFQTVVIHPRGLNEKLSIEIEIIRDCPCELIGEGCPNLCIDFEPCVKCRQRNESFTANCMKKFNCEDLIIVPEYNSSTEKSASERVCKINDKETDCQTNFVYEFDNTGTHRKIRYEATPSCPSPFPILSVSLSLMGAIVAFGVALLLIWRFLLFLYDKAEFAKFLRDSENAKWNTDENPLYVGASASFANPAFRMSTKE